MANNQFICYFYCLPASPWRLLLTATERGGCWEDVKSRFSSPISIVVNIEVFPSPWGSSEVFWLDSGKNWSRLQTAITFFGLGQIFSVIFWAVDHGFCFQKGAPTIHFSWAAILIMFYALFGYLQAQKRLASFKNAQESWKCIKDCLKEFHTAMSVEYRVEMKVSPWTREEQSWRQHKPTGEGGIGGENNCKQQF